MPYGRRRDHSPGGLRAAARARRWTGTESVPAGTTAGELPGLLGLDEPELAVLVNGRYAPPGRLLEEGDRVAILRPSEGG